MRKVYMAALSLVLIAAISLPAFANANRMNQQYRDAGDNLAAVIELIMTRYTGRHVTVENLTEAAMRGMASLLDEYSVYLNPRERQEFLGGLTDYRIGIGISMIIGDAGQILINRVFPGSPAHEAGLRVGDVIISVDGQLVYRLTRESVSELITNPRNPRVLITIQRGGVTHTFDILKAEIATPTVLVNRLELMPEAQDLPNLQYFRVMQINTVGLHTANDVRQAIGHMKVENVRGIILDLRNNGGGYLDVSVDIANQMVPSGTVLQTVNRQGQRRTYTSVLKEKPFDYMIVLVNRFTASAAEVLASALQDSGAAVVVGEQSYGKGLVQSIYALRCGGAFKLTTEVYYRRNGGAIDGIGVIPDVKIERVHIFGGPDNVMRRGLEELLLD